MDLRRFVKAGFERHGGMLGMALHSSFIEVFARNSPSIWSQTYDKDGLPLASGGAVVIAPEILVTNCMSCKATTSPSLSKISPSVPPGDVGYVHDLCQIKAKTLTAPAVESRNCWRAHRSDSGPPSA